MSPHKFRISHINEARISRPVLHDNCTPSREADRQFEYRIKNFNEQHERVAKEHELRGRVCGCSVPKRCLLSRGICCKTPIETTREPEIRHQSLFAAVVQRNVLLTQSPLCAGPLIPALLTKAGLSARGIRRPILGAAENKRGLLRTNYLKG